MTRQQVDLNRLRTTIRQNQQNQSPNPTEPKRQIFVGPNGKIVEGSSLRPGEHRQLSEVQQGIFAHAQPGPSDDAIEVPFRELPVPIDLNRLQASIRGNQGAGDELPAAPRRKVWVTPTGDIVQGVSPEEASAARLSEVQQGIFASLSWDGRSSDDGATVAERLPPGTEHVEVDGTEGWLYSFADELGEPYTMFLYSDGSLYQVKVVWPEVEGQYGPHDAHLYSDGTICFGEQGGLPTLEQAYAKSVLWATGFSIFLQTDQFPFSINND